MTLRDKLHQLVNLATPGVHAAVSFNGAEARQLLAALELAEKRCAEWDAAYSDLVLGRSHSAQAYADAYLAERTAEHAYRAARDAAKEPSHE